MDDFNDLHANWKQSPTGTQTKLAVMEGADFAELQNSATKVIFTDTPKIVLLEDDAALAFSIKLYLEKTLHAQVITFSHSSEFIELFLYKSDWNNFCFLTDLSLGQGHDGLFYVDLMHESKRTFFSIVMTGFATIENAIAATKKGIHHYLTKPFELDHLARVIKEGFAKELKIILKNNELEEIESLNHKMLISNVENFASSSAKIKTAKEVALEYPQQADLFMGMIGRSNSMRQVFDRIQKVSFSSSTVLINGESGTGKELVAKAIHLLSSRKNKNMISVNCGAIPSELLESELFGHLKGAFTGAIAHRKGKFEIADQSTIFLDEIGDMPKLLQVKILRILQTKQFEAVGSNDSIQTDVRVIAATHRNLEQAVLDGKFREDLYYRLNVIPIRIPSLRERKEDIPLLMAYFLKKFVSADKSNLIHFSVDAFDLMMNYSWPGNVRELENLMERLVILKGNSVIHPDDLPMQFLATLDKSPLPSANIQLPDEGIDLKKLMLEFEENFLRLALKKSSGNKNKAAQLLGINRTTLIEKLKRLDLGL